MEVNFDPLMVDSTDERVAPIIRLLGLITHDWNRIELQIVDLISWYTNDRAAASIIASRLGNVDRISVLSTLADYKEMSKRVRSSVDFAGRVFDRLRENRNVIVHSFSFTAWSASDVRWTRVGSKPGSRVTTRGTLRDLKLVHVDMRRLGAYLFHLLYHLEDRSLGVDWTTPHYPALPRRFPLPRKLAQLYPEAPQSGRRQPSKKKVSKGQKRAAS